MSEPVFAAIYAVLWAVLFGFLFRLGRQSGELQRGSLKSGIFASPAGCALSSTG